jgi:hypothetical protein
LVWAKSLNPKPFKGGSMVSDAVKHVTDLIAGRAS